jgi:Transmembrane secretion effector
VLDLFHYLSVANAATQSQSPWRPLHIPLFRNLLVADLISDIGMFMQNVGAAWLMTSLTASPMYVALIQTASAPTGYNTYRKTLGTPQMFELNIFAEVQIEGLGLITICVL